ncbi:MAG: hypothetical protein CMK92_06135 [Pseudomonas sp.]|nr:hypothetical protein [Pseudomonas sp.]
MYTDIQNYHEIECLAKTRMKSDGAYCVYLVRVDFDHEIPEELIIGHDDGSEDYKFDPYGKEKYESIYSREPYEIDGVLITPPKKIGVFA